MSTQQKQKKNWAMIIEEITLIVSLFIFCVCLAFFIASSILTYSNLIKLHNTGLSTPDCWKEVCKNWWSLLTAVVSDDGKLRLWGSTFLYIIAPIGEISFVALIVSICMLIITSREKNEKK